MSDKKTFMQAVIARKKFLSKPVPIVPFDEWDYYYNIENLEWRAEGEVAKTHKNVIVPKGFVTDLASIPSPFWALLPPAGPYSYPAIVHDYLYWFQPCDREEADEILRIAMKELDVSAATVTAIYEAVRLGGGSAWSSNLAARNGGEKRILKKFPTDMKTTWQAWKTQSDVFAT
jgi:hypothetical protein